MKSTSRRLLLLLSLAACGDEAPSAPAAIAGTSGAPTAPAAGSGAAGAGSAGTGASTALAGRGTTTSPDTAAGAGAAGASVAAAGTGGAAGAPMTMPSAGTGVAAAGSGGSSGSAGAAPMAGAGGAAGSSGATGSILPPIEDPGGGGPFDVRRVTTASGLSSHSLFVPDEPGTHGKYPMVVWTCGNGGTVDFYASFLQHLASHGFFIVADKGSSSDRQAEVASQGAAIDWIIAENGKQGGEYAGKFDVERIAVMGHSLGSLASFGTAGKDMRIRTSVHYSGGLTGNPVGFDMAALKTMTKPAAFLCGGADSTAGPSCAMDFDQAPPALPVFYGVLQGASHIGPFGGEPRAGQYGRAGVAWLRWQLASDPMFASWFTGPDCTLCKSPWTAKQRNLN